MGEGMRTTSHRSRIAHEILSCSRRICYGNLSAIRHLDRVVLHRVEGLLLDVAFQRGLDEGIGQLGARAEGVRLSLLLLAGPDRLGRLLLALGVQALAFLLERL